MFEVPQVAHKDINVGTEGLRGISVFLVGHSGSWKTTWCAQWPGVVFISIASEGGDDSLITYPQIANYLMSHSRWQEQGLPFSGVPPVANISRPPNFQVKSREHMESIVDDLCLHHKSWNISTVVIDGLNYLVDLWIENLLDHRTAKVPGWKDKFKKAGGDIMDPGAWGMLNLYLNGIRVKLAGEGLNLIITCLQNDIYESDSVDMTKRKLVEIAPLISGRSKVTLPGACKLHINTERTLVNPEDVGLMQQGRKVPKCTYWTSPSEYHKAFMRHKYAFAFPKGKLQDPEFGDMPTFRSVWMELASFIKMS